MSPESQRRAAWQLVIASIALSAIGQLCMKAGMHALAGESASASGGGTLLSMPVVVWTAVGLASYAVSMLAWLGVLRHFPLSYAYPLLSLSYPIVYVGATHWAVIGETATPVRTAGTLLIALGVALSAIPATPERVPADS